MTTNPQAAQLKRYDVMIVYKEDPDGSIRECIEEEECGGGEWTKAAEAAERIADLEEQLEDALSRMKHEADMRDKAEGEREAAVRDAERWRKRAEELILLSKRETNA